MCSCLTYSVWRATQSQQRVAQLCSSVSQTEPAKEAVQKSDELQLSETCVKVRLNVCIFVQFNKFCLCTLFLNLELIQWNFFSLGQIKLAGITRICLVLFLKRNLSWKNYNASHLSQPCLTHSIPWNKALVPCGCAPAAHGLRPSFHEFCFCCLGKHSQTATDFKRNFLPLKGENSISSYCVVLTLKSAKYDV